MGYHLCRSLLWKEDCAAPSLIWATSIMSRSGLHYSLTRLVTVEELVNMADTRDVQSKENPQVCRRSSAAVTIQSPTQFGGAEALISLHLYPDPCNICYIYSCKVILSLRKLPGTQPALCINSVLAAQQSLMQITLQA
jgi:hypothetical protein